MKTFKFCLKNDEKAWHLLLLLLLKKTMIKMNGCVCHDARKFFKNSYSIFQSLQRRLKVQHFRKFIFKCFYLRTFCTPPYLLRTQFILHELHPSIHPPLLFRISHALLHTQTILVGLCKYTLETTNSCRQ